MNLSVKNVPPELASKLKERARKNHRSLQGELMAILEQSSTETGTLSPAQALAEVRQTGLSAPSESASLVRAGRDAR